MKRTLTLFILTLLAIYPAVSALSLTEIGSTPLVDIGSDALIDLSSDPLIDFDGTSLTDLSGTSLTEFGDTFTGIDTFDRDFDSIDTGIADEFFTPEDLIDFDTIDQDTFGIERPAEGIWDNLVDQTITQGSPDNTIVYPGLPLLCNAPGDKTVEITSTHGRYDLAFERFNLVIRNLEPEYLGTELITVTCNGVEGSFKLTVVSPQHGEPATWKPLQDQAIQQSSPDGTVIYPNLALQCTDPDDPVVIQVTSSHEPFDLAWNRFDLVIKNLNPAFAGNEVIELDCNGLRNSFTLHIVKASSRTDDFEEDDFDAGVFIGSIRVPSDIVAGQDVDLAINVKNNGRGELENLKVTATIPELALRDSAGPFDLRTTRHTTKHFHLALPEDLAPGEYMLRITIHNNDVSRVVHRPLIVEYY